VELSNGVAVRVAALCLDSSGRLSDKLLHDDAVRGGLVLDLALVGRLEMTDDSIVVDATPTGFLPADRLLAAIGAEPERSLDGWLDERRIGLPDLAATMVESGRWAVSRRLLGGRRYVDRRPEETLQTLARRPAEWSPDWTAEDCCVSAVGGAAGVLDRQFGRSDDVPPALARATGIEWATTAVVDHLRNAADRYLTQRTALGTGLGF
jgi:hypothetical protein